MKKSCLLLAVLLIFTALFSSCGPESAGKTAPVETKTEENAPAEKKVLTMATNAYFRPYEYYDGENIVGIDVEIAQAIAKELGMELKVEDMQFDSILTAVSGGAADFGMAGLTITEDRLKSVDFSTSYANGVQIVITLKDSAVKTIEDLEGKKIGAQLGTTGDTYITEDFGEDAIVRFPNINEAVSAMLAGDVDCIVIDDAIRESLIAAHPELYVLETAYADEDYAIAVAKGNSELLNKIDAAILKLTADGTIDAILAKYIG